MQIVQGQTAFITGGASGIGLGVAKACGRQGFNVMIADIESTALDRALGELRGLGYTAEGVQLDVSDRAAVEAAAVRTYDRFGEVHLVHNNAGVVVAEPLGEITNADWDWIVDVNLRAVVHGMEAFAPRMIAQGTKGHFVNTASIAGLLAYPVFSPYTATKFAVMGMSEGWRVQLAPHQIGVSVFCPGAVRTNIFASRRNRADSYGAGSTAVVGTDMERSQLNAGLAPETAGEYILDCVADNEPYIFTHVEFRPLVEKYLESILSGFAATRGSASMGALPEQALPAFF